MSGISITGPVQTSTEGQVLLQKKVFGFANGFYILHKYDCCNGQVSDVLQFSMAR